jgi:hypothetical protein
MTTKGIICRSLSVGILLTGFRVPTRATVLEYTNQSSFTTATSGVTTITFAGPGSNQVNSYSNSSGYVNDGATFVGYDNASGPSGYDLRNEDVMPDWGSGAYLDGPGFFSAAANAGITVTLPSNTFAIATNIMASGQNPGTGQPESDAENFQIVLSTGPTVYTVASLAGYSNMAFVGFTSDTAITSITFSPQSTDHMDLDNFEFGQLATTESSATPEAGTSLLCGSGLLLLVRFLRRRRSLPQATASC